MKTYLIVLLILLLLCGLCVGSLFWSANNRYLSNKALADLNRARIIQFCNNKDLVLEIRDRACQDYRKEGGYNGKNYGEPITDEITELNHYITNLFYVGDNKDLIIYSSTKHSWPGEVSTKMIMQYQGEYADSYVNSSNYNASESDVAYYSETEDLIYFYIENLGGHYPNNELYEFDKLNKILRKVYFLDSPMFAHDISSWVNNFPLYQTVKIDSKKKILEYIKEGKVVARRSFTKVFFNK